MDGPKNSNYIDFELVCHILRADMNIYIKIPSKYSLSAFLSHLLNVCIFLFSHHLPIDNLSIAYESISLSLSPLLGGITLESVH